MVSRMYSLTQQPLDSNLFLCFRLYSWFSFFFLLTMILVQSSSCWKQWLIFVKDLECTQCGYSPTNTIYFIFQCRLGFETWTTWLRNISHYHLCQLLLYFMVLFLLTAIIYFIKISVSIHAPFYSGCSSLSMWNLSVLAINRGLTPHFFTMSNRWYGPLNLKMILSLKLLASKYKPISLKSCRMEALKVG